MTESFDKPLSEVLRFNPKWWWDPVPEFFIRYLDEDRLRSLLHVQLEYQHKMLEAEIGALDKTMEILGK